MRKLIMWNLITLDGYFEGEKPWDLGFHELVWGKELEHFSNEQLKSAELLIFGRKTFEGMADYWTKTEENTEEQKTAVQMNKIPKLVCSTKLSDALWRNTTIVRNAVAELKKLKQEGDGNMFVFGSGQLSESLIKADLFDEYRLCIVPAFLGKGRQLFREGLPHNQLKFLEARPLQTGGIILRYAAVPK